MKTFAGRWLCIYKMDTYLSVQEMDWDKLEIGREVKFGSDCISSMFGNVISKLFCVCMWCACMFTCVWVHVHVWVYVHMCAYGGLKLTSSDFFNHCPFYLLRQGLSLKWSSLTVTGLGSQPALRMPSLCLPSAWLPDSPHAWPSFMWVLEIWILVLPLV